MFERIGGCLGLAFYTAQAVALGGGLVAFVISGDGAGRAWMEWTLPPMIVLGIAVFYGMPLVGTAMVFWRLVTDTKYGNG